MRRASAAAKRQGPLRDDERRPRVCRIASHAAGSGTEPNSFRSRAQHNAHCRAEGGGSVPRAPAAWRNQPVGDRICRTTTQGAASSVIARASEAPGALENAKRRGALKIEKCKLKNAN